ncbi:MAG: glycosyl transferase family 2 [Chloroflexota bacterium]|nr:MAG: glycosyl transferase family 2 [Chloroflexota bacterium]
MTEDSAAAGPPAVPAGPDGVRVVVVMPAYNAAKTLERTYADIPHDVVDHVILVDDVSADGTVEIARRIGLEVIVHRQNLGYGGNQKTCYDAALAAGADVVVMLHPDYQYDATRIPDLVRPIVAGERDLVLGSRFLGDPLAGGMPRWKYVANRFLTTVENLAFGLRLSEYHTGLRAYSRRLLEAIPYHRNSNDFVFDQELIAQVVALGLGHRIGEIAVPTRYFAEASSVGFRRSVVYGWSTLAVVLRYLLHRAGLRTTRPSAPSRWPRERRRRVAERPRLGRPRAPTAADPTPPAGLSAGAGREPEDPDPR